MNNRSGFRSLNNSVTKRVLNLSEPVNVLVWKAVIERIAELTRKVACPCGTLVRHCIAVRMACLVARPPEVQSSPSGPGGLLMYAGQLSAYSQNISDKGKGFNGVLFNL